MKHHHWAITLTVFAMLQVSSKELQQSMSRDEQIQHQVNMILEWSHSKTKEELNQIKDTIQFLNPRPDDNDIIIEAKKKAKQQLFPAEKSYWQQYAPQFMQNAVTSTKNYAASWIPQSIKDRVNTWSTKKKLAVAGAALTSLLAIYNKDQIIKWMSDTLNEQPKSSLLSYKEKKALGLPTTMSIKRSRAEQDPEYIKRLLDIAHDQNTRRLEAEQPLPNRKDEASAQKIAKEILREYYEEEKFGRSPDFLSSLLNRVIYKKDTPIMNRARAIALQIIDPKRWEDEYYVFN